MITIDVDPITGISTGGSSAFSDNSDTAGVGRGSIAHSNSDIALSNVTASDNAGGGAELDNTYGTGSILLTGNNTFNDNGFNLDPSVGLYAISNYNISLSQVTALRNGYGAGEVHTWQPVEEIYLLRIAFSARIAQIAKKVLDSLRYP